jgi:beta-lactamase class A
MQKTFEPVQYCPGGLTSASSCVAHSRRRSLLAFSHESIVVRIVSRRSSPYGASDIQDWYAPVAKANLSKGSLSVREMCRAAVEESDNTCANLLLSRVGGPSALTAFWRKNGDQVTRLEDPEPFLNRKPLGDSRDTTTPAAMAQTLRRYVLGRVLSEPSRTTFTEWLVGCQTGANRLRAGLPTTWVIGDKTGNNSNDAAGDIAVVWPKANLPIVICVYTRGGAPSAQQIESAFAGIGRFVGVQLSKGT